MGLLYDQNSPEPSGVTNKPSGVTDKPSGVTNKPICLGVYCMMKTLQNLNQVE